MEPSAKEGEQGADSVPNAVRITPDEGSASVLLEIVSPAGTVAGISLNFDALTSVVRKLGEARMRLHSAPPPALTGLTLPELYDPRWFVQPEPMTEGSALSLYHPAYGPLGFVLPRQEVATIVRVLSVHLTLPTADRGKAN